MRRRVLSFVTAVWLILCVATLAGAIWAMRGIWSLQWRLGNWDYGLSGSSGKLYAGRDRGLPPPVNGMRPAGLPRMRTDWSYGNWIAVRAGDQDFLIAGVVYRQWFSTVEVAATMPAGIAATGLVAVFAGLGIRRARRRRRDGACAKCAYDLTGNTSGVCPECGTPVADKAGVKG